MSTRSISWGKGGRCVRLTTLPPSCALSWNLRTLISWNPLGYSRPVLGLLYLYKHRKYCPTLRPLYVRPVWSNGFVDMRESYLTGGWPIARYTHRTIHPNTFLIHVYVSKFRNHDLSAWKKARLQKAQTMRSLKSVISSLCKIKDAREANFR